MNTKIKIKKTALFYFNKDGINATTLRNIADYLDKSYGNITYHYKTKLDLLLDLFSEFESKLHSKTSHKIAEYFQLIDYFSFSENLVRIQLSYAFFYADQLEISRKYPSIWKSYDKLRIQIESKKIIQLKKLQQRGLILKNYNENTFEHITALEDGILLRSFLSNTRKPDKKEILKNQKKILYPYLTDKGKLSYIKN